MANQAAEPARRPAGAVNEGAVDNLLIDNVRQHRLAAPADRLDDGRVVNFIDVEFIFQEPVDSAK
ncbi:hypothetical protein D3C83_136090 [compost metagenome]